MVIRDRIAGKIKHKASPLDVLECNVWLLSPSPLNILTFPPANKGSKAETMIMHSCVVPEFLSYHVQLLQMHVYRLNVQQND